MGNDWLSTGQSYSKPSSWSNSIYGAPQTNSGGYSKFSPAEWANSNVYHYNRSELNNHDRSWIISGLISAALTSPASSRSGSGARPWGWSRTGTGGRWRARGTWTSSSRTGSGTSPAGGQSSAPSWTGTRMRPTWCWEQGRAGTMGCDNLIFVLQRSTWARSQGDRATPPSDQRLHLQERE